MLLEGESYKSRAITLVFLGDSLTYYRQGAVDEHFVGPKKILPVGVAELYGQKTEEYVGFDKGIAITREGVVQGDPNELNARGDLYSIDVVIYGLREGSDLLVCGVTLKNSSELCLESEFSYDQDGVDEDPISYASDWVDLNDKALSSVFFCQADIELLSKLLFQFKTV